MDNFAISTWILRDVPLEQAMTLLGESDFDIIELSGTGSALLVAWEQDCVGAMRRFESAGISVPSIHCTTQGRRGLDFTDQAARQACIALNAQCFERMKESGIPEMVLHAGGEDAAEVGEDPERRKFARDSLQRLADLAGDMGLRIAVENAQKTAGPTASMARLSELVEGLGDHVGLCHDVGHSALAELDPVEETRSALATGRLFSLHLHDVDPDGADHAMPGEGHLALDALVDELDRAGFSGLGTIELKPFESDIASRLAQAAKVRDAWASRAAAQR